MPNPPCWCWWHRTRRSARPAPGPASRPRPRAAACCAAARCACRRAAASLLQERVVEALGLQRLVEGNLFEVRLLFGATVDGVVVVRQLGDLLGLGVRHQLEVDRSPPCAGLTAWWRITRAEAAGLALHSVRSRTGMTTMTAPAVASAMRIRTAPPFVWARVRRARLCSVKGGLRPMHSRPERRAGRRHPFWLVAAGCAAGSVQPLGYFGWVSSIRDPGESPAVRRVGALSI